MAQIYVAALEDIAEGLRRWRLWGRMGWGDIRRRYRRTVLGPFWTTLSMAILVVSVGIVFATLWKMDISVYLPFLCTGLIAWIPISTVLTESCNALVSGESVLKQVRVPYSLFIYATVWRNLIVMAHHLVVYVVVARIFDVPVNMNTLLVVLGVAFFALNSMWIGLLLGMVCVRYRDLQALVGTVLPIVMLVTPIFWPPELLAGSGRLALVDANVFYHVIDVIRAPLLGKAPAMLSWIWVGGLAVFGWSITFVLFSRFRSRLCYWL